MDFARDELGLDLSPAQSEMIGTFHDGRFSEAVWQCGRRGGKSLLADCCAVFDAVGRDHLRARMRPGEVRVAGIVAPRIEQARTHISTCAGLVRQSRRLRRMLESETGDELRFRNGSAIRAYPCSARTVRGDAWSSAILDELAHYVDSADGPQAGERVVEAVAPSLAQFGADGWLIQISTPRWRQGAFYAAVERAASGRFDFMHYRHRATAAMNPRIPLAWLEQQHLRDPDLWRREFLAQFLDGASSYLASADVMAAVRTGRGVLPPVPGRRYVGALDPAFSRDRFALVIAHTEQDSTGASWVIVDGCWTWQRQGFGAVLDQVAAVARAYRIDTVTSDQYAEAPVVEGMAGRGIGVKYVPWTNASKLEAFGKLKAALATRAIEIPDDAALIDELVQLEARPTAGGAVRIAAAGSGHDDRAVALAAAVAQLTGGPGLGAGWMDAWGRMGTAPLIARDPALAGPAPLRVVA